MNRQHQRFVLVERTVAFEFTERSLLHSTSTESAYWARFAAQVRI